MAIDPDLLARMDVVVTPWLRRRSGASTAPSFETWSIDEPSERGIEGMERMRLVRDDISQRVRRLCKKLLHHDTPDDSGSSQT